MTTTSNLARILVFLDELSKNNNRPWFEDHRSDYEASRENFYQFVDDLIDQLRPVYHLQGLAAKDCVPRIYRDVRFSKDKSPYKTNFAAMIALGGWRGPELGCYFSLEPHERSLVAGGFYSPTPGQLASFRQTIHQDAAEFKGILAEPRFSAVFGGLEGERLKTAPKGYAPDHPEIALLQYKQVVVMHHYTDAEVLSPGYSGQVVDACRILKPFLDYLSAILK